MRIGAAPVSFGVYGIPEQGSGVSPDQMVEAISTAGYEGAELPPAGYAGPPGRAAQLMEAHGLEAVGIYIPIHFANPALQLVDERRMEDALRDLETARTESRIAIIADEGSDTLLRHPGRGDDPTYALGPEAFDSLCSAVQRLATLIRRRGLVPSFHPHISTYVENPAEVERLLELTDIDLTFDTGHIALGGGEVLACFGAWRERINHIHLKDVRHDVMEQAKSAGRQDFDVWWADVSTPLGEGDLRLKKFLALLEATRYRGWVVVEQDRSPVTSGGELRTATELQTRNLQWIRRLLATPPPGR